MYPFEGFNPSFLLALPSWRDRKSENDKGNKSFNHNCQLGIPISILSMRFQGACLLCNTKHIPMMNKDLVVLPPLALKCHEKHGVTEVPTIVLDVSCFLGTYLQQSCTGASMDICKSSFGGRVDGELIIPVLVWDLNRSAVCTWYQGPNQPGMTWSNTNLVPVPAS